MIELNKIYHADCMELMKDIPDGSVDLVLTSPPYNLGSNHHTGNRKHNPYCDNMDESEYQQWQINILNECCRILKDNGSILYNHKNRIKAGVQITPYQWLLKTNLIIKQELVWFNGSQNFDKIRFYPMTERIFWLSKNINTDFYNTINRHDLFNWEAEGIDKQHTRAFPLKMAKELICCFPNAKIVLDCFSGSGTTAMACIDLDRSYICIEKDKDYYEASLKRIQKELIKIKLF